MVRPAITRPDAARAPVTEATAPGHSMILGLDGQVNNVWLASTMTTSHSGDAKYGTDCSYANDYNFNIGQDLVRLRESNPHSFLAK